MRLLVLVFFITGIQFSFCQDHILTVGQIQKKEHATTKAFQKYIKHPNRSRLKKIFLNHYTESLSKYNKQLDELNSPEYSEKPWIEILNTLHSLYYLDNLVLSQKETASLHSKDYKAIIDSVSSEASKELYDEGNKYLNQTDNPFGSAIAYRNFKKVLEINPDYKNTKDLLDVTILKGKKNVYFAPVTYKNQGNYFEISSDGSSISSNYILEKIIENLTINNVGSKFERSKDFDTNWEVDMTWNSINISPEKRHSYDIKRSKIIQDNGKETTVSATVTYTETIKNITGNMIVIVKDSKTNEEISRHNFPGNTTHINKTAKFKGDERALTFEDNALITKSYSQKPFNDTDLIIEMFNEDIYRQFISDLGGLFNWNL
ncbi:hypothetical protein [Aureivirga marina]|uniref:hypothetical protein n=1 Tax=Aureivirga marina TaxID=1182451 RepID=UPI0018CA203A|nr:hypothetical protein [Aureivirga marina]